MQNFISITDAKGEIKNLVELGEKLKKEEQAQTLLKNKTLGMIFEKASTRTRISFEVGMYQLGGMALYLPKSELQLGRGEPIADTAKVMSRFLDAIMIRSKNHDDVLTLGKYANIPVISGLTDKEHPCQVIADLLTIKEYKNTFNLKLVFIGDGNNVCNSLLLAAPEVGMDMTVACPKGYEPDEEIYQQALKTAKKTNTKISIEHDINEAVKDADVLYTDVWVSMGDEAEKAKREEIFKPYQINQELLNKANKNAIVLHCLPAIRNQEITEEVINGPQSAIWDEAENRLHAQKAILYTLLKD